MSIWFYVCGFQCERNSFYAVFLSVLYTNLIEKPRIRLVFSVHTIEGVFCPDRTLRVSKTCFKIDASFLYAFFRIMWTTSNNTTQKLSFLMNMKTKPVLVIWQAVSHLCCVNCSSSASHSVSSWFNWNHKNTKEIYKYNWSRWNEYGVTSNIFLKKYNIFSNHLG